MGNLIEFKPDCNKKLSDFAEQPERVDLIWQFHHHLYLSFALLDKSEKTEPLNSLVSLLRTPLHASVYRSDRSEQYKRYFLAKHLDIVLERLQSLHPPEGHPGAEAIELVTVFLQLLRKVISRCAS